MTEETYIKIGGGIGINKIGSLVYRSEEFVRKVFYKILRESVIKSSFGSCGKNVHIAEKSDIKGIGNISIGDDVAIGPHALLWTTRANIIIKEKVIIGPGLSIITGDHKINVIGKYMADVTDEEKDDENDQDVIIEKDVWIGAKIYNEQSRIVIRAAKFVGFFVLLAYMGVSTYYQIELGYSGVIVMMLVGKALREKYYGRS